ncbi:MAG: putative symporter YjmB [Promethearchaeota archaeon]|nr:MAG: putative symporter YjmB [Candidatus Lokiarchaeota archaeon]
MTETNDSTQGFCLEDSQKYSKGKFLSYSAAWFMDSFFLAFFGQVVFYFYEKEILLNVILIALAYTIFSIWNAINDPLLAYFTEKPRSWSRKFGLRTIWILAGAFGTSIMFFFIYFPPSVDATSTPWPIFIYFVIVVCLYDLFYTIFNSNYTAASVSIFRTDSDRRKIGASALIFSTLGTFVATALVIPLFIQQGNLGSYATAAFVALIILLANSVLIIPGMIEPKALTERYISGCETSTKNPVSLKKVLKTAVTNKNFLVYVFAYLSFSVAYNLNYLSTLLFITDVLRADISVSMISQMGFILGFLVSIPVWIKVGKKIGHAKTFGMGYILLGCAFLPFMWGRFVLEYVIYYSIAGFLYGASAVLLMPIISDTYDEITAALGRHQEATLQGVTNFFFRFSYMIAAGAIAAIHVFTGFDPIAEYQVGIAVLGVRIHSGLIGGILCIIAGIFFLMFYDMYGEKKLRIQEQLKQINL